MCVFPRCQLSVCGRGRVRTSQDLSTLAGCARGGAWCGAFAMTDSTLRGSCVSFRRELALNVLQLAVLLHMHVVTVRLCCRAMQTVKPTRPVHFQRWPSLVAGCRGDAFFARR